MFNKLKDFSTEILPILVILAPIAFSVIYVFVHVGDIRRNHIELTQACVDQQEELKEKLECLPRKFRGLIAYNIDFASNNIKEKE